VHSDCGQVHNETRARARTFLERRIASINKLATSPQVKLETALTLRIGFRWFAACRGSGIHSRGDVHRLREGWLRSLSGPGASHEIGRSGGGYRGAEIVTGSAARETRWYGVPLLTRGFSGAARRMDEVWGRVGSTEPRRQGGTAKSQTGFLNDHKVCGSPTRMTSHGHRRRGRMRWIHFRAHESSLHHAGALRRPGGARTRRSPQSRCVRRRRRSIFLPRCGADLWRCAACNEANEAPAGTSPSGAAYRSRLRSRSSTRRRRGPARRSATGFPTTGLSPAESPPHDRRRTNSTLPT